MLLSCPTFTKFAWLQYYRNGFRWLPFWILLDKGSCQNSSISIFAAGVPFLKGQKLPLLSLTAISLRVGRTASEAAWPVGVGVLSKIPPPSSNSHTNIKRLVVIKGSVTVGYIFVYCRFISLFAKIQ